ncbi:MAG: hypothetical protein NTW71_09100 [Deltaproteobacteria bacterium]|nr:hypothetical protein [Deltaproteobacteria bacterium]
MSAPELLKDLLVTIQCLQKELGGSDAQKIKAAQETYWELLDRFCEEYQDMMTPQQHRAAKDDPDCFPVLIKLAIYHEKQENVDKQEEPSLYYPNWKLFTQI